MGILEELDTGLGGAVSFFGRGFLIRIEGDFFGSTASLTGGFNCPGFFNGILVITGTFLVTVRVDFGLLVSTDGDSFFISGKIRSLKVDSDGDFVEMICTAFRVSLGVDGDEFDDVFSIDFKTSGLGELATVCCLKTGENVVPGD